MTAEGVLARPGRPQESKTAPHITWIVTWACFYWHHTLNINKIKGRPIIRNKLKVFLIGITIAASLLISQMGTQLSATSKKLDVQSTVLQQKEATLNNSLKDNSGLVTKIDGMSKQIQESTKTIEQKDAEITQLKATLQTKKATPVVVTAARATVSGNWIEQCTAWAAQAGIPFNDAAIKLIDRESDCNPNAVNPSSSACGVGQQLPCGKWPGAWNDPIAGLRGMYAYVSGRYGSWDAALAHSYSTGWY